jgi:flagellar hook-basal body complex protein FliE
MNVAELQRLQSTWGREDGRLPTPRDRTAVDGGFADTLNRAIQAVDRAQKAANEQVEAFVAGEQENLHEVMISMNQARLYFQLMTEIRNRLLETYQELMRTQI